MEPARRPRYEVVITERTVLDESARGSLWPWGVLAAGACATLCAALVGVAGRRSSTGDQKLRPAKLASSSGGRLDEKGRFVLDDFDTRKPFASFLPGIGGEWGKPMWAFYVNRGQALAAFGIETKDEPLLEFTPANKAYERASIDGFRTLLRVSRCNVRPRLVQPFFNPGSAAANRTMLIGMNELEISEVDVDTNVKTRILYYTVPEEDFPALVRHVTLTNLGDVDADVEVVDGLARLEPFGVNAGMLQ